MSIEKNSDLINFINDESKIFDKLDLSKIFKCFCKCLVSSLLDIYNKFKNIENLDLIESIILGSHMVYHIFWVLIIYTNNLKLTIFLTERATLLYTEFIIMSRDPKINKDLYFTPNISDGISFAYKKSIGPLKISDFKNKNYKDINSIKNVSYIYKYIVQEIFSILFKISQLNKLEFILNNATTHITSLLLKIFNKNWSEELYTFMFDKTVLIFSEFDNIILILTIWKLYFEILLEFIYRGRKVSSIIKSMELSYDVFTEKILQNSSKFKNELNLKFVKKFKIYTDMKYYISNIYNTLDD